MSATFTLYIVNEGKLPRRLGGATDQAKYEELVAAVRTRGARWAVLRLRVGSFIDALDALDARTGGARFLSALSFANSPHSLLEGADCPAFGYFSPGQARDLHARLQKIAPEVKEQLCADETSAIADVLHAFGLTAAEATRRGYAVAVVHS
jgi:hypothetical protein